MCLSGYKFHRNKMVIFMIRPLGGLLWMLALEDRAIPAMCNIRISGRVNVYNESSVIPDK